MPRFVGGEVGAGGYGGASSASKMGQRIQGGKITQDAVGSAKPKLTGVKKEQAKDSLRASLQKQLKKAEERDARGIPRTGTKFTPNPQKDPAINAKNRELAKKNASPKGAAMMGKKFDYREYNKTVRPVDLKGRRTTWKQRGYDSVRDVDEMIGSNSKWNKRNANLKARAKEYEAKEATKKEALLKPLGSWGKSFR